jgi:hypothetical protein
MSLFKIAIDSEALNKMKAILSWIKEELSPIVIIALTIAVIYQTKLIHDKDALYVGLQTEIHNENKKDAEFWKQAYFQTIKLITDNEDINLHNDTTVHSKSNSSSQK